LLHSIGVLRMSTPAFSLRQLGWRAVCSQQLTLADLDVAHPARVTSVQRGDVTVASETGEARVTMPGSFASHEAALTVGDWVLIDLTAPRVLRVLERYSVIERLAAGTEIRRQPIAANVDTAFIVTSCNDDFNLSRLERYLVLARDGGVVPVIVLTKADLCTDSDRYVADARRMTSEVDVLALDATSVDVANSLSAWLAPGQTVTFVGSSGVGKSTLVNTLMGAHAQPTCAVREHDAKGRHTTTARQMFALNSGAWVIDTPGMRELRVGAAEAGMSAVFHDVEALARHCRFRDCRHDGDQGCAVLAAIAAGQLDARRLENYLKLQREAMLASRSVRERRERERHLGRLYRSAQRVQRDKKGRE
jgi:ribosome biogenesis GTPase / thiamine phosphate phosphatase